MFWRFPSLCSRNRTRRVSQTKQGARRENVPFGLSNVHVAGCIIALCCAGFLGYYRLKQPSAREIEAKANAARLQAAIDDALGKDRRGQAAATRFLRPSFDSMPKDSFGSVNSLAARHLLHGYFSNHGWRVDGLDYHGMRLPNIKTLHSSLESINILKHGTPELVGALKIMGAAEGGFALDHIAGLAAVIRGKLWSQSHSSRLLRMLYKQRNLSFTDDIDQDKLRDIIHDYVVHLNVVDRFGPKNVSEAALNDTDVLDSLTNSTLNHLLKAQKAAKVATRWNFSSQQVVRMADNLTSAFEKLYVTSHCEPLKKQLVLAAPNETGRLQPSTFYAKPWDGSHNRAEPKRFLKAAGALDDSEANSSRVLIANYMHGHLNCIRHSEHYSVCCPNQCVSLMRRIEASILAPAATPEKLLELSVNLTSLPTGERRQIPASLIAKMKDVAVRHGGVVPLHGRLFALWLHYTFPNECPYPQETKEKTLKRRLMTHDITKMDKEQVAWATLSRGFDWSANVIRSGPWDMAEVLPLQAEQVLNTGALTLREVGRGIMFVAALVVMLQILAKLAKTCYTSLAVDEEAKAQAADLKKAVKRQAFDERVKNKLDAVRFEFALELARGKDQEKLRLGLQLKPANDAAGGIVVEDVLPDGLVSLRNKSIADSKHPVVLAGDRLVSVNDESSPARMMEELSGWSSGKMTLRFSRESSKAAPLIWTADLERFGDEPWGMSVSTAEEAQNTKELTISRVVAKGPVDKWNRRATNRNKGGIYPGDIIFACDPEVDTRKILATLQKEKRVQLTILRWNAAISTTEPPGQTDMPRRQAKEPVPAKSADEAVECEVCDITSAPVEEHRCECCDASISDKYVLMCCNRGDNKYFRRTCWRQKYGGFTVKHMPRRCPCGSPLAKLEVYERSGLNSEARLVHTILDGPMEIDISFEDAPDNEDRPAGHRRAASMTRRANEGDARRRAASTGRRRVGFADEGGAGADEHVPEAEPFFRAPASPRVRVAALASPRSSAAPAPAVQAVQRAAEAAPQVVAAADLLEMEKRQKPASSSRASTSSEKGAGAASSQGAHAAPRPERAGMQRRVVVASEQRETQLAAKPNEVIAVVPEERETQSAARLQEVGKAVQQLPPLQLEGKVAESMPRSEKLSQAKVAEPMSEKANVEQADPWFRSPQADPWARPSQAATAKQNSPQDPWFSVTGDPWARPSKGPSASQNRQHSRDAPRGRSPQRPETKSTILESAQGPDTTQLARRSAAGAQFTELCQTAELVQHSEPGHDDDGGFWDIDAGLESDSVCISGTASGAASPFKLPPPPCGLAPRPPTPPPPPLELLSAQTLPPPGLSSAVVSPIVSSALAGLAQQAANPHGPPGLSAPVPEAANVHAPPGLLAPALSVASAPVPPGLSLAASAPPGLPPPSPRAANLAPPGLPPPGLLDDSLPPLSQHFAGSAPPGLPAPPGLSREASFGLPPHGLGLEAFLPLGGVGLPPGLPEPDALLVCGGPALLPAGLALPHADFAPPPGLSATSGFDADQEELLLESQAEGAAKRRWGQSRLQ